MRRWKAREIRAGGEREQRPRTDFRSEIQGALRFECNFTLLPISGSNLLQMSLVIIPLQRSKVACGGCHTILVGQRRETNNRSQREENSQVVIRNFVKSTIIFVNNSIQLIYPRGNIR